MSAFNYRIKRLVLAALTIAVPSSGYAACTVQAGELGYDDDHYIADPKVKDVLLVMVDCTDYSDIPSGEISIVFDVAGVQCDPFVWEMPTLSEGYSGAFPDGYKGQISATVSTSTGAYIGESDIQILTKQKRFASCPRRNPKCRKTIETLSEREKKKVCTGILDFLRGRIILRPK